MSEPQRKSPCVVRDGKFVEPCDSLAEVETYNIKGMRGRGVVAWRLLNMRTNQASRTFFGVKSGKYADKGVAFNFCPFCGTNISAPFTPDDEKDSQP